MSLNRFMHPRNIYKDNPPDFKKLAQIYPELAPFVHITTDPNRPKHETVTLDFENPTALRALTCALLHHDFQLTVQLPLNHLIPTVPSRLNYILWVEDLLAANGLSSKSEDIWGLDIGAGASCIYPLLGAKKNGWKFVATEANDEALDYARENVKRNGMDGRIVVIKGDEQSPLLSAAETAGKEFVFCMTNPPFFESEEERREKASYKPPKLAGNPIAESDAVAEGGEVAFVGKMVQESQLLGKQVRICTSMLGKKSSLTPLKGMLQAKSIPFVTTEFCQGRTMRWGLAWSTSLNLTNPPLAHPLKSCKKPPSYEIAFGPKSETERMALCVKIVELLRDELKMNVVSESSGKEKKKWRVSATEYTWRNQRQKRRKDKHEQEKMEIDADAEEMPLAERSDSRNSGTPASGEEKYLLQFFMISKGDAFQYSFELTWIDGENRDLLHEIVVFLKNRLKTSLQN